MRFGILCCSAVLFGSSASCFAATTIGSLSTAGTSPSSGSTIFGQSFIVPAGETVLSSASLAAWTNLARSGTLEVWLFSDDGSTGSLLAPVASSSFSLGAGDNQVVTKTFNAAVTPGDKLAVLVNWGSPQNNAGGYDGANYYADGSTFFESQGTPVMFTGSDNAFSVTFGVVPEPASAAVIGAASLIVLRRRK